MRTAIVTGEYHIGGETFINRHIQHLFGGDTVVVCGRFHGSNPYDKAWFARRERPTTTDLLTAPYWMMRNRILHNTSRLPFGRAKRDLTTFLRDQKVELILAEFGTQALAMAPLANELDLPIFTYFRGTDASKAIQTERMREAYRRMMPRLAGVFSVSQFLLDNLARHDIRHPDSVVIPSGVDVRRFVPGQKQPLSCLAVGRFVEKKAPLTTLRSFAEATRDLPHARLDFIGDGPLLAPAQALAEELGAKERVIFHGSQPHDFVRGKLATAQFFLQHSITAANGNTEGLPTAIQEAMACGCITVSTRHAGIPEAIDEGKTGWLVEEHDADGFTTAIGRAMQATDTGEMASLARRVAEERFDNDVLLKKLETHIRATLA
ncbi:glycosyltransferase involved in cell wall biosynthesis [Primorskyibacter sedentarius]|uniref:Glycosyltransferase involved in cell wall biosynthesis n=1 Tax=Primorskyibacter sedentarius TaxID=745311 RepID=A0A4R3JJB4_9RHOB|nr:glycosyltransferase [Primorskyibacter sedentarius]TCS65595.1 glycosyltransferase involved in cell wall biosynthesis [Primorskyibacter sedentarius]